MWIIEVVGFAVLFGGGLGLGFAYYEKNKKPVVIKEEE